MAYLASHPVAYPASAKGATCVNPNLETFKITPQMAKLTLKTVAARENDPSVALAAPAGVLKLNLGYKGAYTKTKAQTTEFDFTLDQIAPTKTDGDAKDLPDHQITQMVYASLTEIAKVDHAREPCFRSPTVKVTASFDVQNKNQVGGDITLVLFKIGDQETFTDEFVQTLEFDFLAPDVLLDEKIKLNLSPKK